MNATCRGVGQCLSIKTKQSFHIRSVHPTFDGLSGTDNPCSSLLKVRD